jgi:hypothetical protein
MGNKACGYGLLRLIVARLGSGKRELVGFRSGLIKGFIVQP